MLLKVSIQVLPKFVAEMVMSRFFGKRSQQIMFPEAFELGSADVLKRKVQAKI